jgi:DNA replication and repair protein RecF
VLVRALSVDGFRNLAPLRLEPGPRFNVISGDNGQGKTNLLEAIYLVGTLRSFRAARSDELIAWGERGCEVAARVVRGDLERVYRVTLGEGRRTVELDDKRPRTLGDYFGDFNVVLFAPEDLRVPRGSPAQRRRFLDRSVFNRRATFLEPAQRYARVLRSRNVLLRSARVDEALLEVYDDQLAAAGAEIITARRAYLLELEPGFTAAFADITAAAPIASLSYRTNEPLEAARLDAAALRQALLEMLVEGRRRDLTRRLTGVGPHLDDVEIALDGRPARAFASQGQLRALVLAWKTAEMRLLGEVHGDPPVLLLDDVSSELDPRRNELLFDLLNRLACQSFVTTTHPRHVLAMENRMDFQVVAGTVTSC